ncbi:Uncharacterized protein GBIM_15633 [Gryllus bimaculatus]|nr:Uncharacterized protein GBIM_15633 [Gryllus bimaculatus]
MEDRQASAIFLKFMAVLTYGLVTCIAVKISSYAGEDQRAYYPVEAYDRFAYWKDVSPQKEYIESSKYDDRSQYSSFMPGDSVVQHSSVEPVWRKPDKPNRDERIPPFKTHENKKTQVEEQPAPKNDTENVLEKGRVKSIDRLSRFFPEESDHESDSEYGGDLQQEDYRSGRFIDYDEDKKFVRVSTVSKAKEDQFYEISGPNNERVPINIAVPSKPGVSDGRNTWSVKNQVPDRRLTAANAATLSQKDQQNILVDLLQKKQNISSMAVDNDPRGIQQGLAELLGQMIPQRCSYRGRRFDCGLSISCVLAGGRPLDLCSGGLIWACCVSADALRPDEAPAAAALANATKVSIPKEGEVQEEKKNPFHH